MTIPGRTVLASDDVLALVELHDGERESVLERCDDTFDPDPDDRPIPLTVPRSWAGLVLVETGEVLGTMSWRPVPHIVSVAGIGWNQGFHLLPTVQGRGLSSRGGLLLARYLFDTTEMDRIQAVTDPENVPARRGLEGAGFRLEGRVRGVVRRAGVPRDLLMYSMMRADLDAADAEREVLVRGGGVLLATSRPGDRRVVAAGGDDPFRVDRDHRLSPEAPRTPSTAAVLDEASGDLLGVVRWHAVGHGDTFGCAAWTIAADLVPAGRDVAVAVHRMLAGHLFDTTGLDRVEAGVDAEDESGRRVLEKAGFQLDGVLRGARVRDGRRRDLALYGLLRTECPKWTCSLAR
ncbi:GNAT family N-acetyltransferase [Actinophytocola xinjiangensis]|uniref:GNAT family N-acetyltransferase n=1 Tax=Actinophytocola xinjiangensis TaxID=485602 RepID=UPI00138FA3F2|nr:GNAT family protein [Actinophytocola xinjiangensis]